jgi:hypothetical protein
MNVDELKAQYRSFKEAKELLGIPARGWEDLAAKLNTSKVAVAPLGGPQRNLRSASTNKRAKLSARLSTPFGDLDLSYSVEAPSGITEGLSRFNGAYGCFGTQLGTLETLIETE